MSALMLADASSLCAQDVRFDFNGAGQTKAMTHWGVDTAWPSYDNMRQSLFHMGKDQTDVVRVNFFMDEPLDANGQIGPRSRERIDRQLELAALAGNKPLALTPATGEDWDGPGPGQGPTHPSYLDANGVAKPAAWLALMEATQAYIGKPIHALEVFNEPDFWLGMGPPETLLEILTLVQSSPNFQGTELHAASTLSSGAARSWYDVVSGPTTHGTLHQLAGSADDYINFIGHVRNQGDIPYNPELHSMAEVLYGCEYGLLGGIWWADALHARGLLVNAVQGQRLGYAELRWTSSAAAVYRAPDGEVYGFAGSFERHGPRKSYRFVCNDQDVYFNGIGPLREFMMPTWEDQQGGYFHIDAVADIPALDGHRWKIVNRATGQVLEVENGSADNGANLRTAADTGALHQRWHIARSRDGYYSLINAGSGKAADLYNWSLEPGGRIAQWDDYGNLNQKWWIKSKNQGYFYLHNGHSNFFMEAAPATAGVRQAEFSGQKNQQWTFVLADAADRGALVAHYAFDGNAQDSSGNLRHGSTYGGAYYTAGKTGQAVSLNGGWDWWGDHVALPGNVANSKDITVATWVYWRGGHSWQRIFDFGVDRDRYMYLTPAGDGQMKFAITTRSWWDEESLTTATLPKDQWVHVALTLGGNTAKLYLNGRLQIAGHIYRNPSDLFDVPANYWNPNWTPQNYIGRSKWVDPTFNGVIDDFRIYDYALSAADIAALLPRVALLEDGFDGNFVKWGDANGWDKSTLESVAGGASAHAGAGADDLISKELDASGRSSIEIEFWHKAQNLAAPGQATLKLHNGHKWIEIAPLGGTESTDTWQFFQTTITDPQFMIPNLKLKFEVSSFDPAGNLHVDELRVVGVK